MSTKQELAETPLQPAQSAQFTKRGLSIEEFGQLYGICRSSTYVEIRKGRLKARKIGRRTVIALDDAEAWFASLARVKAAA